MLGWLSDYRLRLVRHVAAVVGKLEAADEDDAMCLALSTAMETCLGIHIYEPRYILVHSAPNLYGHLAGSDR